MNRVVFSMTRRLGSGRAVSSEDRGVESEVTGVVASPLRAHLYRYPFPCAEADRILGQTLLR